MCLYIVLLGQKGTLTKQVHDKINFTRGTPTPSYAEVEANPRNTNSDTKDERGFTSTMAWEMLEKTGYYPEKK